MTTPSKADIKAANQPTDKTAGPQKAPDRPFPEVLREDAGRLARKLLAHPEVSVWLGDNGATLTGLVKLSTYTGK